MQKNLQQTHLIIMKKSSLILWFALCGMMAQAQESFTENPRGVYKLMTIESKGSEVVSPFEQYKICLDNVTLHCSENGSNRFSIGRNDREVFNYTGENPKDSISKTPLIYNSNAKQFTLKWWSTYRNHYLFPENDWCLEHYQSGKYSESAEVFFNAITTFVGADKENPLIGQWRLIGLMDELKNTKKEVAKMREAPEPKNPTLAVYTPSHIIIVTSNQIVASNQGMLSNAEYNGKKSLKINGTEHHIKWLSKDCIAIDFTNGYRTDYEIWQRIDDEEPIIKKIADKY